jgi:HEAT repeat protein
LSLLNNEKLDNDVYSALAARALSIYPSGETLSALKKSIKSKNWNVRCNAAESLIEMGICRYELTDILKGDDVFAKDIIKYKMKHNEQDVID